jgi:hypothetical protein
VGNEGAGVVGVDGNIRNRMLFKKNLKKKVIYPAQKLSTEGPLPVGDFGQRFH